MGYNIRVNCFKLSLKKKKSASWLIFSLPQTNQYQVISDFKIVPKPTQIIKDERFFNNIACFDNPNSQISFKYKGLAINKKISNHLKIGEYHRIKTLRKFRFINGNDKHIKQMAKKVVGQSIILNDVITKLYKFTLGYLTYGKPIDGLYSYSQAMEEKITDCGGFSTFLASLLESKGIACRLVVGFLVKTNFFGKLSIHAWLEARLPDHSWFPLDPSIEWRRARGLSSRQGGFGYIPDDRLVVSYGEDFNLKIKGKIYQFDLLQKPVSI